nr:DUF1801 domain-containing protein [Thaumasiovibrio subtropicus]
MPHAIAEHLLAYPASVLLRMHQLRALIYEVATSKHQQVNESLKWGEPSFHVNGGSPVRLGWKASTPEVCYVYFHCQTKLIATFRERFEEALVFSGNRAIVLSLDAPFPELTIRRCLEVAFEYKKRKALPLLGL